MTSLVGTGSLARLALRRDRLRLAVWVLAIPAVTVATASAFAGLYPTVASRQQFGAGVAGNPTFLALTGPLFDASSIGGLVAWRMGGLGAVLVALMSLFAVVRHTRADEEAGRLELVGAGVVGRRAPLTAALLVAFGAALAVGALVALGLIGVGLPARGAMALGLALASAGWMFAAVAATAAQLTGVARGATGIAAGVLALSYLLRAAGDSGGASGLGWLSWLSPVGWTQQVRPFAAERWWVLGLALGLVLVLVGVAYGLVARRDIGAGLLPPRLGPAEGAPGLRSPMALAWRLQRASLFGWTVGFLVFGAALGSAAEGVRDLLKSNPQLGQVMAGIGGSGGLVDLFLSSILGMMGLVSAAYAVQATLRLRSEETSLRAEPVLATATGRVRWAASHLMFTVLGTVVLLVAAGVGAGLSHGLRIDAVAEEVGRLTGATLVHAPAALVLAGIAVALFGLLPRLTAWAWGALAAFLLIGQLGPLLRLDHVVMDLSPFTHVPKLPGGELTVPPLAWLMGIALLLTAAGLAGFRRRDIG